MSKRRPAANRQTLWLVLSALIVVSMLCSTVVMVLPQPAAPTPTPVLEPSPTPTPEAVRLYRPQGGGVCIGGPTWV